MEMFVLYNENVFGITEKRITFKLFKRNVVPLGIYLFFAGNRPG
jgi:hypothetical protein